MKRSEEIEAQIEATESRIKQLDADFVALQPATLEQLSVQTRSWIDAEVRRTVERNPGQTESLGTDRLRLLKASVNGMTTDFREWVTRYRPFTDAAHEDFWDNAHRSMIGRLGGILADYGFVDLRAPDSRWKRIGGEWAFDSGTSLRDLPRDSAIEKARKLRGVISQTEKELTDQRAALASAKAREAFDAA